MCCIVQMPQRLNILYFVKAMLMHFVCCDLHCQLWPFYLRCITMTIDFFIVQINHVHEMALENFSIGIKSRPHLRRRARVFTITLPDHGKLDQTCLCTASLTPLEVGTVRAVSHLRPILEIFMTVVFTGQISE